jgi:hypothetical protein
MYAILSTWLPSLVLAQPFVLERQAAGIEE